MAFVKLFPFVKLFLVFPCVQYKYLPLSIPTTGLLSKMASGVKDDAVAGTGASSSSLSPLPSFEPKKIF